jgi:hypothetical protein
VERKPLINHAHTTDVIETLHDDSRAVHSPGPSPQECLAQIDRFISSPLLLRSESLCRLVQYLAEHSLNSPTHHLKEYQIATEALERAPDFDPQLDSSVRVLTGRLRSKLAEYYKSAGVHDPILVDVPKGTYTLSFERRIDLPEPKSTARFGFQRRVVLALAILAIVLLASGAVIYVIHQRVAESAIRKAVAVPLPMAFQTFWNPFLRGPQETIVVFSNAIFVGNPETGFRYFVPSRDSRDQINQHYTGIGELLGVLELDRLFQRSGSNFRVKPGGFFTFDEARSNNLIFVGSPMENLTLRQIPTTQEFVFRRVPSGENQWSEVIADLHPRAGESGIYPPASEAGREDTDYALVALMPGLDNSHWTLILAGRSTISTQAAVDYVCDQSSLNELLQRLNFTSGTDVKPFEALLRVKTAHDVPIETKLVGFRLTNH